MSIGLQVEPYCETCPEFDPEDTKLCSDYQVHRILVTCKHRELCKRIRKLVLNETKTGANDGLDIHTFKD